MDIAVTERERSKLAVEDVHDDGAAIDVIGHQFEFAGLPKRGTDAKQIASRRADFIEPNAVVDVLLNVSVPTDATPAKA